MQRGIKIHIERVEARTRVYGTVLYTVETGEGPREQLMTGMLRDLSTSGACLYLQERYGRGEKLRLTSSSFGPPRDTEVMWSKKVDDGLFKTGVRFIQAR